MDVKPTITIAGCGPGAPEYVTPAVQKAVGEAEVLVGAPRLLALFAEQPGEKIPVGADIEAALRAIAARCDTRRVVVLVTGDPGLCSLARPVLGRFGRDRCRVIPGISAVQVAFAAISEDWLDARIIDAHGEMPEIGTASLRESGKIAVLMGSRAAKPWAAGLIGELGDAYRAFLCEDLTLPEERVREIMSGQLEGMEISSRSILIICKR